MAPRKSLKPAEPAEADDTVKAPAKARTPRARAAKPAEAPEAAAQAAPARKPRAPKAGPAVPEAQAAEVSAAEVSAAAGIQASPDVPAVPEAPASPEAAAEAGAALLTPHAGILLKAIHDGSAVELLFCDADANPPRTFEPRQLVYDALAKGWYVWGWDRRYNAERHHRLDLLAQVGPVEGMGRAAQGPYREGTPANQVGGWLGGEPIHVRAVLLKQWIFAVRQAPAPFPDFHMEDLEEGKAQVTFVGTDLRAIARWVMQFGDGIQVLEPQRLLDRVKQVGIAWSGKAVQERPAPAPQPQPQPRQQQHNHKPQPQEHRPEPRESAPERRRPEPPRHAPDPPKAAKPGKIEIRIDRL